MAINLMRGGLLETPEVVRRVYSGDGGIVHYIDADPEDLFIGMPMKAVLKSKAKRAGSILDIEGFKPVE